MILCFFFTRSFVNNLKININIMNVLKLVNTATGKFNVKKSVESLIFYSDSQIQDFANTLIDIQIDRNGEQNLEITKGFVPLLSLVSVATTGRNSVTSFPVGFPEEFKSIFNIELASNGALELMNQETLQVELKGIPVGPGLKFEVDANESPVMSTDAYLYDEDFIAEEYKTASINTKKYDVLCMEENSDINYLNISWSNGKTTKHTPRELRALVQDIDQCAVLKDNGNVIPGFSNLLVFPLVFPSTNLNIESIEVNKNEGSKVKFFARMNHALVQLGIIKR